ncbi:L-type lectin-domain containing receptor kinase IX.2 isoform X1 [Cryptomeria japonica]|uniref:L-type lectin-domain containing receptor kinase IX.2 isoform X1 n=1 Tax=Cryptomeria japonica TaxID=3369 RepID=UPI0025AC712A|nr:L-type lectin-domain containing receptor kinase IX.2 isoform X1 [Cryptomeria japonica]XP_059073948.1 L-type lectin-domain containing receptor kinase IX.2 isoform X1 [Cryptomeria japonica]
MFQAFCKLVFLSFLLLCIAAKIKGQDETSNITGYSCSDGPTSCDTYVFYKAQAPNYLNLRTIGDLFLVTPSSIATANDFPDDTSSLAEGQSLLIPIACTCMRNYSQANITFVIPPGGTFWKISTENFEHLTTYQAVEIANPTLVPENLTIGTPGIFPIRCQCPSRAQISEGIKMQITYVVQEADTLESISEKFDATLEDLKSANGMSSNSIFPNITLLIPVFEKPTLVQSQSPALSPSPSPSSSTKLFVGVGSGIVACIAGALWIYFYIFRRKRAASIAGQMLEGMDLEKLLHHIPRRFKMDDLIVGTNNFSETQKLGEGGFGGVYKCNLVQTNEIVAVKRISEGSRQGIKEFISEVSIVSRLRHRNLVQLLGWCQERDQLLLVYEYMSNGSLDRHIFPKRGEEEERQVLQWSFRYKIASEIAIALLYLHEEWDECVVHRDIKSSNVLLDSNFSAKIGDFGLARMVTHDRLIQTTRAAGTLGYLAPECVASGKTSPQSDVYSFGAVALEIASGKRVIDVSLVDFDMRLVAWAWDLYGRGRLLEGADVRLNGEFKKEEMERLMVVGLWCSHPDAASRPKMKQVLKLLNFEVEAPGLPHAMPVPSYAYTTFTTKSSLPHSLPTTLSPR